MNRTSAYFLISLLTACNFHEGQIPDDSSNSDTVNIALKEIPVLAQLPQDSTISSSTSGELVNAIGLAESNINEIPLPFPLKDMTADLATLFGNCSVQKEMGQQDGPDFPLYSVTCSNKDLVFFSMDYEDTLILDNVRITDSSIEDEYGLRVGDDFSKIKDSRGVGLIVFDPYHYHMYYTYDNSKIYYELIGELRSFDIETVEEVVINESDISDWKIQYINWR